MTNMKQRRGTAEALATANELLGAGVLCVETDTGKFKIGNGIDHWNDLPYAGGNSGGGGETVDAYTKEESDAKYATIERADEIAQEVVDVQGDIASLDADKQDKLTAGEGITIDENNVISATGGGGGGTPTEVDWTDIEHRPEFVAPLLEKVSSLDKIIGGTLSDGVITFDSANAMTWYVASGGSTQYLTAPTGTEFSADGTRFKPTTGIVFSYLDKQVVKMPIGCIALFGNMDDDGFFRTDCFMTTISSNSSNIRFMPFTSTGVWNTSNRRLTSTYGTALGSNQLTHTAGANTVFAQLVFRGVSDNDIPSALYFCDPATDGGSTAYRHHYAPSTDDTKARVKEVTHVLILNTGNVTMNADTVGMYVLTTSSMANTKYKKVADFEAEGNILDLSTAEINRTVELDQDYINSVNSAIEEKQDKLEAKAPIKIQKVEEGYINNLTLSNNQYLGIYWPGYIVATSASGTSYINLGTTKPNPIGSIPSFYSYIDFPFDESGMISNMLRSNTSATLAMLGYYEDDLFYPLLLVSNTDICRVDAEGMYQQDGKWHYPLLKYNTTSVSLDVPYQYEYAIFRLDNKLYARSATPANSGGIAYATPNIADILDRVTTIKWIINSSTVGAVVSKTYSGKTTYSGIWHGVALTNESINALVKTPSEIDWTKTTEKNVLSINSATTAQKGIVKPDNNSIVFDENGALSTSTKIVSISQTDYDALTDKDANTLYIITE